MRALYFVCLLFLAGAAHAQLSVEPLDGLSFDSPVGITNDGVDSNLLYVIERRGTIQVTEIESIGMATSEFLDIDARVSGGGEKGLLGLAFHPDYDENGLFYVYYSTTGTHRSRVSQFTRSDADVYPPIADPDSEVVLLEEFQPFGNHNGGGLAFGSDGYLYVSLGDGGSGGDPKENGQDETTLLGSILRLDVDGEGTAPDCGGSTALYTIPADNALADGFGGACDEIYAWGLRNPWRFSFDRTTDELWIADVGQNAIEEIDLGVNGGNYGWNTYEGTQCFDGPCDAEGLLFPVWEYNHSGGNCSITGGYVYRGSAVPELAGQYVYGDFCSGRLWALDDSGAEPQNTQLSVGTFGSLTTFGEDLAGELYFAQLGGTIYRFISDTSSSEDGLPESGLRLDTASPNPSGGEAEIAFQLGKPGSARLAVYDMLGREVARLYDGAVSTEVKTVRLDGRGLASGVYVVRLDVEGRSVSRRITLTN